MCCLRYIYLFLPIFILFNYSDGNSQQLDSWRSITSFNTINDITADTDKGVWGVTEGGLFNYDDNEFVNLLTPVEGMYRLNGQNIYSIPEMDLLVIGYSDGMIDIYDINSSEFTRLEDINRVTTFTLKGINDFIFDDGRLYVATDFGVVVYLISNFLVEDSFSKIGNFDRGIPVVDIELVDGQIIVATQQGIAIANLADNLNSANSWQNYDQSSGLPQTQIIDVVPFNNELFATDGINNYRLNNTEWESTGLLGFNGVIEFQVSNNGDYLTALSIARIAIIDQQYQAEIFNTGALRNTTVYSDVMSGDLFIGTAIQGLGISTINDVSFQFVTPTGPNLNFFNGMVFDGETFISATTRSSERDATIDDGKGYFIQTKDAWNNFNRQNNTALAQSGFRLAFTTAITDDYYYFGSWGRGIARHHKESNDIHVFNNSNSTLEGWVADDPAFPVISGLDTDNENDIWAVSRLGSTPLYYQKPGDDDFVNYSKAAVTNSLDGYVGLMVDSNNQKWITLETENATGRGLLILNTGESDDANDQTGVKLTDDFNNGNLPNNRVTDIIEDRNGEVWIGTERGIARFVFPQFVITGNIDERRAQWLLNEDPEAESPFLLRDISVTAMDVNPANQKWIGTTNDGIWLLNEQGSRILKHFNTDNSPLLSNSIRDIRVKETTGEVYIATDQGLIIYQDTPVAASSSMTNLKVYPNPFEYQRHEQILIEGLSERTSVRVLGADGSLIRTIDSRAGRIEWDGLDFNGRQVGSGVYMIVALGENGERGVGKVVIIR